MLDAGSDCCREDDDDLLEGFSTIVNTKFFFILCSVDVDVVVPIGLSL